MKRYIFILLTIVFLASSYFIVRVFTKGNNIFVEKKSIQYNVLVGGLNGARDFTSDGENIFIAFKDRIQVVEKNGKSYTLFKENKADIKSLEYYKGKLFIINNSSFSSIDIQTGKLMELFKDIPNFGDYGDCKLMVKEDNIYIAIGAATNSGVVGADNIWKEKYPFNYDIPPKDITITENVNSKNGAFVPYNTKNLPGQKISGHFPGNASVIVYNPENNQSNLFSWGIRNVKALDFDSYGKIYAAVGGMEPRGERAVKGDVDYIYELKAEMWYGWPDYSGGDPINSPRFKGERDEKIPFLLQKHPSNNPPAPLYQHKSFSTLSALAVDKAGIFGSKDSIFFYDNLDNIIYSIDNKGIVEKRFSLNKASEIISLKMINSSLLILEANEGLLVQLGNEDVNINSNSNLILIFVIIIIVLMTVLLIWKLKN